MKYFFKESVLYKLQPLYKSNKEDRLEYKITEVNLHNFETCCKKTAFNRNLTVDSIFGHLNGRFIFIFSKEKEKDLRQLLL